MNAEEFNAAYPVGTPVLAYPGIRPDDPVAITYRQRAKAGRTFGSPDPCTRLETRTRSTAWELGCGEPVVMVDGYAGGIALTHIDIADTAPNDRPKENAMQDALFDVEPYRVATTTLQTQPADEPAATNTDATQEPLFTIEDVA